MFSLPTGQMAKTRIVTPAVEKTVKSSIIWDFFRLCSSHKACFHGGRGPQVGEVTHLSIIIIIIISYVVTLPIK